MTRNVLIPSVEAKNDGPRWIWLASYPKSGNTWLRAFLQAYMYGGGKVDINRMHALSCSDTETTPYHQASSVPLGNLRPIETMLLRPAALLNLQKLVVVDGMVRDHFIKTHCAYARVCGIELFPKVITRKAIYIIRDPRDVAVSYAHYSTTNQNEVDYLDVINNAMNSSTNFMIKDNICYFLGTWRDHVSSWTEVAPKQGIDVLVIKYEDMVRAPNTVFRKVLDFLQVDFDRKLFSRSVEATSFKNMQRQEKESPTGFKENPAGFSDVFFRRGLVGSWREELPASYAELIEAHHGEVMATHKYKPSRRKKEKI